MHSFPPLVEIQCRDSKGMAVKYEPAFESVADTRVKKNPFYKAICEQR
jgi:hypothetical protein